MTVQLIARTDSWVGRSGDAKPASASAGSTFYETDTGKTWTWNGSSWIENIGPVDSLAREELILRRITENIDFAMQTGLMMNLYQLEAMKGHAGNRGPSFPYRGIR